MTLFIHVRVTGRCWVYLAEPNYPMRSSFVYIMTNATETLYIGVTSNIERRMYEHKMKLIPGFTQRYKHNALDLSRGIRRYPRRHCP